LVISGFSVFGVAYLQQVLIVGVPTWFVGGSAPGLYYAPVAGPFALAQLGFSFASEGGIGAGIGFGIGWVVLGAAELTGLGLGITGSVMLGRTRQRARLSAAPGGLKLEF
jgi:hypothetical protein